MAWRRQFHDEKMHRLMPSMWPTLEECREAVIPLKERYGVSSMPREGATYNGLGMFTCNYRTKIDDQPQEFSRPRKTSRIDVKNRLGIVRHGSGLTTTRGDHVSHRMVTRKWIAQIPITPCNLRAFDMCRVPLPAGASEPITYDVLRVPSVRPDDVPSDCIYLTVEGTASCFV